MRWSVGSSAIECSSQSAPGAPWRTQCSVPPLDVFVGCQLAPSATSSAAVAIDVVQRQADVVFRRQRR